MREKEFVKSDNLLFYHSFGNFFEKERVIGIVNAF